MTAADDYWVRATEERAHAVGYEVIGCPDRDSYIIRRNDGINSRQVEVAGQAIRASNDPQGMMGHFMRQLQEDQTRADPLTQAMDELTVALHRTRRSMDEAAYRVRCLAAELMMEPTYLPTPPRKVVPPVVKVRPRSTAARKVLDR
jgi:hypothetical protein